MQGVQSDRNDEVLEGGQKREVGLGYRAVEDGRNESGRTMSMSGVINMLAMWMQGAEIDVKLQCADGIARSRRKSCS